MSCYRVIIFCLVLFLVAAEATVLVSPDRIDAADLHKERHDEGATKLINITFTATDPNSLEYVDFESLPFPLDFEVRLSVVTDRDHVLPYGFGNLQDDICPPRLKDRRNCIAASGSKTALIELHAAPIFDIKETQIVEVIFSPKLFNPARTKPFVARIKIVPSSITTATEAYAITLPLLLVDVVTAFVMPTTQDLTTAVLIPHMTCATNEERGWFVAGVDVYLPFVGVDVFTRAVLVLALIGALVVGSFIALRVMTRPNGSATLQAVQSYQCLFPLILSQVWFYFAPRGLSFAAGRLMGAEYPRYQVFGAFIQIVLVFSFVGARQMLLCDPRWEWCRSEHLTVLRTFGAKLKAFNSFKGFWFFKYGEPDSIEKRWATTLFPREFDSGVRLRLVLPLMWLLNSLVVTILSGSPRTPSSCFTHYVGLGIFHLLITVFIVRVRAFRSYILVGFTVSIRLATAIGLFLLSSGPGSANDVRFTGYFMSTGIIFALGLIRLVWWFVMIRYEEAPEVQRGAKLMEPLLEEPAVDEEEDYQGEDHKDSDEVSSNTDNKKVTFSSDAPIESLFPVEDIVPESAEPETVDIPPEEQAPPAATATARDAAPELQNLSTVSMGTSFNASMASKEPRWLQDASKLRVKAHPDDVYKDEQPLWFPEDRPHVRNDNVGDVPLKYSPYMVRKGTRHQPN